MKLDLLGIFLETEEKTGPLINDQTLIVLMVIGGCVRDGVRRIRLPKGVKSLKCLTGQTVRYPENGFAEVDIDCGKAAIFAIQQ